MPHRTRLRVEYVEPVIVGSGPNKAFGVDQQHAHPIARQRLRLLGIVPKLLESLSATFPARHTSAFCRKPKIALQVFCYRPDVVAGQRVFVAALMAKLSNTVAVVAI